MKNIFIHPVYVSLEKLTRKENDVSFLSQHLLGNMVKFNIETLLKNQREK